jgi:hypothetical protein
MPHFEHLCALGRCFLGILFEALAAALFRIAFVSAFTPFCVLCNSTRGWGCVRWRGQETRNVVGPGPGLGVLFSLVHQSQNQSQKKFEDEVVYLDWVCTWPQDKERTLRRTRFTTWRLMTVSAALDAENETQRQTDRHRTLSYKDKGSGPGLGVLEFSANRPCIL